MGPGGNGDLALMGHSKYLVIIYLLIVFNCQIRSNSTDSFEYPILITHAINELFKKPRIFVDQILKKFLVHWSTNRIEFKVNHHGCVDQDLGKLLGN